MVLQSIRLYLTENDPDGQNYGRWFVDYFKARAAECRFGVHTLAISADEADAILILERGDEYGKHLRRHPLLRTHFDKVFVYETADRPIPYLPGLYSALPKDQFNPSRHAAAQYLAAINPSIAVVAGESTRTPDLFFSFIGADNSAVRRKLFSHAARWTQRSDVLLEVNYGWSNRGKEEGERKYAETLARSRFVLCPRGIGTATFRLFETMELGRVPVILSDAWVAPLGPQWDAFSIRIPEGSAEDIPKTLARFEPQAEKMGQAARASWEEWFAPNVQFHRAADEIKRLLETGDSHPKWLPWSWGARAYAARIKRSSLKRAKSVIKKMRGRDRGKS